MTSNKLFLPILLLLSLPFAVTACGGGNPTCTAADFSATPLGPVGTAGANANVMPVTVNGGLCAAGDPNNPYPNKPCVSVTICSPSLPSQCQTINDILLDTGSYGLRIFGSVISVPLSPLTNGNQNLAECVQYGDGSSEWGQVAYAYVRLGNEPAIAMPIQVIDSGYGTPAAPCTAAQSTPDTSPQEAGFNGILGVGLFAQDCGPDCTSDAANGLYYTCNGTNCGCGATVALGAQVQNPVGVLPADNNGVLLSLPAVGSSAGVASLNGTLYLGIGTQSNNQPSGVQAYPADGYGNFKTVFSTYSPQPMVSFIDSGSMALFFPSPGGALPDCSQSHGADWTGFYCPASLQNLSATNYAATGSQQGAVSFRIANAYDLLNTASGLVVFDDLGGSSMDPAQATAAPLFDWGLPFFLGRPVYVGLEGTHSSLGTGPYWAY